jgi:ribosomal protein L11 methyltransferase
MAHCPCRSSGRVDRSACPGIIGGYGWLPLRWGVPYRVDLRNVSHDALDRLIELGAMDAESVHDGGLAALMPDNVAPEQIASALGVHGISISPAEGRDAGSVWSLSPRAIRIGRLQIVPAHVHADADALRLIDAAAFGTGRHATTALCLEALDEVIQFDRPDSVLDVGTGSGVLALAALMMGVPRAMGIDIDDEAMRVAAENARINGMGERLQLAQGGPETITGTWPLIIANVLAAPLIEMAPALVRRVGRRGQLVLSGIPSSVQEDVDEAYRRLGMRRLRVTAQAGWIALVLQASW